ncbi:MAG TPA: DUF5946 family protein [Ktedonobacteraceae bacterium]|nr:DUF5946 family protein [Ktedonobacteraceae bacterium]
MSEQCPLCGAILPEKSTCQTIHEELLNFEGLNAIAHSLHFLHVTCFLIQHERYSDEGLKWAQSLLRANLVEDLTEQQHLQSLRTTGKKSASGPRTWKFHREADALALPKIAWSVTIVDVFHRMDSAQSYGESVRQWARATSQEMTSLLH